MTEPMWSGDTGRLPDGSRRALLELIRGPYLAAEANPAIWAALLADEAELRSRLHELFLDLVLDVEAGFAFVRNAQNEAGDLPRTIRSVTLTFLDTAMLLVLRQMLLTASGERRVIVGRDEVFEQLQVYRSADRDQRDFEKRMNASWQKMRHGLRVVHSAGRAEEEDRVELSPVLRLMVDAEQVRAIRAAYEELVSAGPGDDETEEEAS